MRRINNEVLVQGLTPLGCTLGADEIGWTIKDGSGTCVASSAGEFVPVNPEMRILAMGRMSVVCGIMRALDESTEEVPE